jgi:hypothetical protein
MIRTETVDIRNGVSMTKKVMLTLIIMLLVGVSATSVNVRRVRASAVRNIILYGDASVGWGFNESGIISPGPSIIVDQGTIVNLTLISHDGLSHQFFVDYNGNGIRDDAEPESFTFTASLQYSFNASVNGTFTYYCRFHPSVMHGLFIVNYVVPEFPSIPILALFMAAMLLAVIAFRKKH